MGQTFQPERRRFQTQSGRLRPASPRESLRSGRRQPGLSYTDTPRPPLSTVRNVRRPLLRASTVSGDSGLSTHSFRGEKKPTLCRDCRRTWVGGPTRGSSMDGSRLQCWRRVAVASVETQQCQLRNSRTRTVPLPRRFQPVPAHDGHNVSSRFTLIIEESGHS